MNERKLTHIFLDIQPITIDDLVAVARRRPFIRRFIDSSIRKIVEHER